MTSQYAVLKHVSHLGLFCYLTFCTIQVFCELKWLSGFFKIIMCTILLIHDFQGWTLNLKYIQFLMQCTKLEWFFYMVSKSKNWFLNTVSRITSNQSHKITLWWNGLIACLRNSGNDLGGLTTVTDILAFTELTFKNVRL